MKYVLSLKAENLSSKARKKVLIKRIYCFQSGYKQGTSLGLEQK